MTPANELRIGNYIYFNNDNDSIGIITGVIADIINELEYCIIGYRSGKKHCLNNVRGIPLTEEILLKLGFIGLEHSWHELKYFTDCQEYAECFLISYNVKSKRLAISESESENNTFYTGKKIENLHQLQNLYFALTQKELNYE